MGLGGRREGGRPDLIFGASRPPHVRCDNDIAALELGSREEVRAPCSRFSYLLPVLEPTSLLELHYMKESIYI
jgi:hypothetical protein